MVENETNYGYGCNKYTKMGRKEGERQPVTPIYPFISYLMAFVLNLWCCVCEVRQVRHQQTREFRILDHSVTCWTISST